MSTLQSLYRLKDFDTLISQADKDLTADFKDTNAMFYKGLAQVCKSQYTDAQNTLKQCAKLPMNFRRRILLQQVLVHIGKLSNFELKLDQQTKDFDRFLSSWYSDRIRAALNTVEHVDPEINRLCHKGSDTVYVLGYLEKHGKYVLHCQWESLELPYDNEKQCRPSVLDFEYPNAQVTGEGWIYQKRLPLPSGETNGTDHAGARATEQYKLRGCQLEIPFPVADWEIDSRIKQPHPRSDVFYAQDLVDEHTHNMLTWSLDRLAVETKDFFVPQYQNIIDPNLSAFDDGKWTVTDFVVKENEIYKIDAVVALQCTVKSMVSRALPWHSIKNIFSFVSDEDSFVSKKGTALIAGPISTLIPSDYKELHVAAESILTTALPMLAKLRRPALLFPGQLQATVKAQRIHLQPGEEYDGLWHTDGKREDIVAVVIYYYRFSDGIQGGDMEFMTRQIEEFWIGGDCSATEFEEPNHKEYLDRVDRCRVPIKPGTLVVFSNYQMLHRVLKMVYPMGESGDASAPGELASRDFLIFFIHDQRKKSMSTRSIQDVPDREVTLKQRDELFWEQIKPAGKFGLDEDLFFSTGNGCAAALGWVFANPADLNAMTEEYDWAFDPECDGARNGLKLFQALNFSPPLGRGVSWTLELGSWIDLGFEHWETQEKFEEAKKSKAEEAN